MARSVGLVSREPKEVRPELPSPVGRSAASVSDRPGSVLGATTEQEDDEEKRRGHAQEPQEHIPDRAIFALQAPGVAR